MISGPLAQDLLCTGEFVSNGWVCPDVALALSIDDMDHVRNEKLRRLLGYWFSLRKSGPLPAQADIDPVDFAYVLSDVWLCDYLPDSDRFQYRLMGERVRDRYESGVRGKFLDTITDAKTLPRVHGYFRKCVDLPSIVHVQGMIYSELDRPARGERLMLPFTDEDDRPTFILGATTHTWDNIDDVGEQIIRRQVRTFQPVDGSPRFEEDFL